ncbi:MAG: hypothetical protein IPM84_11855 [Anaerolineae bacterium]|nr:hypothetical protein [Anaerolineae bacterium]
MLCHNDCGPLGSEHSVARNGIEEVEEEGEEGEEGKEGEEGEEGLKST